MRDLAVLFLHLLATVARLAGPGGARSVVAESVLVKHHLLILNRSRKRSPTLRPSDRMVAGLCAVFIRPTRSIRSAIVLKPSTLLRLHRALIHRKYHRLFSSNRPMKPGPKGPSQDVIAAVVDMKQRNPSWGCPRIRAADYAGLRYSHRPGCGATDSRGSVPPATRLRRAVLAERPGSHEGPSVACGSVSVRIGRPEHVLGARRDGPLDTAPRGLRRAPWRRGRGGAMPDVQSRDRGQSLPTHLSADHDPLYRFYQWRANLRILNIREIKTVPYVPRSHPVVERLIGTVRRECLDRMLFWTAADLERKLVEFQRYYNAHRTHAGRAGRPPAPSPDATAGARANLRAYRWLPHCRGLYHTPRTA